MTVIRDSIAAALAVVMVGIGAQSFQTAVAAPADQQSAPSDSHRWDGPGAHGHRMVGMPGGMFHALRKLDLTTEQKTAIRSLVATQRTQPRANFDESLLPALGNPGDPKHADAIAQAKQRAAERIDAASALQDRIYALLTADQKARLPSVLAEMQARRTEHRSTG